MATRTHAGLHYRDFNCSLIEKKCARSYLEIGVRDGITLSQVACDAIGVDPNFQLSVNPVGRKQSLFLFQETSDEFFRRRDVRAIFGHEIDVAFLDGLHQFEYLLRDFINTEKVCNADSLIMLDDCLPLNSEMTERVHKPQERRDFDYRDYWTGDVWKLIPILKKYRPDLRINLVDTQPTGTVCITRLDPGSYLLKEKFYEIVDEFKDIHLSDVGLEEFYEQNEVVASSIILNEFDTSIFVGP